MWQRFLIVAAGPVTNFLFAIVAFMIIFGDRRLSDHAGRGRRGDASSAAAAQAGFRPGDRIVAVDGTRIDTFADLKTYVALRPGRADGLHACARGGRRDRARRDAARRYRAATGSATRRGSAGLASARAARCISRRLPFYQLPGARSARRSDTVQTMLTALGQVISGRRSVSELGGPLKIAEVSGQQASLGWLPFFWLMTMVSINLGFINLLPIPLLDGGHLLFYVVEGVRRKPLRPEAQEWAFRTGLAVLLALMIFVTFNDLASFGLFSGLAA